MSKTNYILAQEPAEDLVIVQAMAEGLEDYLIKNDVYRLVVVSTPTGDMRLQMSGGDLLARLHRLQAEADQLTPGQRGELRQVQAQVDETIRSLRTRFDELLAREMKARLSSLQWFWDDCQRDRRRCRSEYPFEIRNRQRLEEIARALGERMPADLKGQLARMDRRIQEMTAPAEFVWDDRWRQVYPREPYWYLYVLP